MVPGKTLTACATRQCGHYAVGKPPAIRNFAYHDLQKTTTARDTARVVGMFDARPLLLVLLVLTLTAGASGAAVAGPQADTQVRPATGVSVDATTIGSDLTDRSRGTVVTFDLPLDAVDIGPSLVAIGYSRFDDHSDPLEHDTRAQIYETVTESPGIYLAAVADQTTTELSTVRYHCRVLDGEGLLDHRQIDGHHCLFPDGGFDSDGADEQALQAALQNDAQAAVLRAVYRDEPVSVSALASTLGRADSTVSYHLDRLESRDLVDREREGRTVHVRLPTPVRETVGTVAST